MARTLMFFIISIIALGACTQRLVCPAYQSAFIYDKEVLRKKFSYFKEDSTPKILTASKTKFLIAEPVSYQRKTRSLQTVEMKPVYPIVPDSLQPGYEVSLAELDSAAHSIIDSTYIVDVDQSADSTQTIGEDSIYVISKDKEVRLLKYDPDSLKYSVVDVRLNVDQDNYMWYLRDHLILPDVRLAKMQNAAKDEAAKGKNGKKGGFFRNLFKKKKKEKVDSSKLVPVKSENDFDYVDTVESAKPMVKQEPTKKKKGFFSFLKKKDKADKPSKETEEEDALTPPEEKLEPKKKDKKKKEEPKEEETIPEEKDEEKDDGF
jgi:hypothetical protein